MGVASRPVSHSQTSRSAETPIIILRSCCPHWLES